VRQGPPAGRDGWDPIDGIPGGPILPSRPCVRLRPPNPETRWDPIDGIPGEPYTPLSPVCAPAPPPEERDSDSTLPPGEPYTPLSPVRAPATPVGRGTGLRTDCMGGALYSPLPPRVRLAPATPGAGRMRPNRRYPGERPLLTSSPPVSWGRSLVRGRAPLTRGHPVREWVPGVCCANVGRPASKPWAVLATFYRNGWRVPMPDHWGG
jgi:hypothetical protein